MTATEQKSIFPLTTRTRGKNIAAKRHNSNKNHRKFSGKAQLAIELKKKNASNLRAISSKYSFS